MNEYTARTVTIVGVAFALAAMTFSSCAGSCAGPWELVDDCRDACAPFAMREASRDHCECSTLRSSP